MSESSPLNQPPSSLDNRLLTGEEYIHHPFVRGESRLYFYTIQENGHALFYFGADHSNDPDNPMFDELTRSFGSFNPDLVLIEGRPSINNDPERVAKDVEGVSDVEARKRGEAFYSMWLAKRGGVEVASPEPDLRDEIAFLIGDGFTPEEIARYYLYRLVPQYQRSSEDMSEAELRGYLTPFVTRLKTVLETSAVEQALSGISLENVERYQALADPMPWPDKPYTRINEVSAASSRFRDEFIINYLKEARQTHPRIFIVYGSGHAVVQEPAIRALFDNTHPLEN